MKKDSLGMLLRIGASIFFTLMIVCIKKTTEAFPVSEIVFFRGLFGIVPLVLYIVITKVGKDEIRPKNPNGILRMCMISCVATFTSFISLRYITLAEATIVGYLTPIMVAIFAFIILKEVVTKVRWISIAISFFGVFILFIPTIKFEEINNLYLLGLSLSLLTSILVAASKIQAKFLSNNTEHTATLALSFCLACSTFGLLVGLIFQPWIQPDFYQLSLLIGAGLLGGVAHLMMYAGYQYSDASKLAGLEFIGLPLSVSADLLFFAVVPTSMFYISATLIFISSIYLAVADKSKKV